MIKIGKILQDKGLVTASDIEAAAKQQQVSGKFLGHILVEMGKVSEENLLRALAEQMQISFVKLADFTIPGSVIEKVPVKYVSHYKVMPYKFDKGTLTVAVSDPLNVWPLEDLKLNLKMNIEPAVACRADIDEAIRKYYGVGADTIQKLVSKDDDKKKTLESNTKSGVQDIEKLAGDASVIKLVNEIIKEAIESRATDIHFELYQNELVVRYRIDGVLVPTKIAEEVKFLYQAIIARIKVIFSLDIVEKRVPQSGGARIKLGQGEYDLRVSVIPDNYSEGLVIRILPTGTLTDISQLGFPEREYEILSKLLKKSYGILYVTGPTGSGKTTTLYSCLSKLNRPDVKIITVEDPVEYKIKYIEQIQVNPRVGLTFANVLRSVLRHDPDIIMVGEVRDAETAQIAVQASLTGHLVFSTLHTNDAPSAVTRLLDMGVEPYLTASSTIGILAQRLVRKVCPHCAKEIPWDDALFALGITKDMKIPSVLKAVGCEKCRFTGYQGRMAIYELLPFTEAIHELTLRKASATEIRNAAVREGMRTLFQAGWQKIIDKQTTPEEILRVVQDR